MSSEADIKQPVLQVRGLTKHFGVRSQGRFRKRDTLVQALDDVSFDLAAGETLGIVGESGCGKSTLGRCLIRLIEPTSGSVIYQGNDICDLSVEEMRLLRRELQIVFQDPNATLSPRMTVREIISEPWRNFPGIVPPDQREERIAELLERVGLSAQDADRYPHQFSGGQRQRIGIARSLGVSPIMIVLDEPVSALDVSVQAQVLNLLSELQAELGLTYVFISHDLSVVSHVADRVAVMYLGKVIEIGAQEELFANPRHPYTAALLSAIPVGDLHPGEQSERMVLEGEVPSPHNPPSGCRFRTRCWKAEDRCATEEPPLREDDDRGAGGSQFACHFPVEELDELPV